LGQTNNISLSLVTGMGDADARTNSKDIGSHQKGGIVSTFGVLVTKYFRNFLEEKLIGTIWRRYPLRI